MVPLLVISPVAPERTGRALISAIDSVLVWEPFTTVNEAAFVAGATVTVLVIQPDGAAATIARTSKIPAINIDLLNGLFIYLYSLDSQIFP